MPTNILIGAELFFESLVQGRNIPGGAIIQRNRIT